jgi:hypothetical protein
MLPSFSEYGLSPGDAVLMAIPTESIGHQADLVVETADRLLSLIESKGTPIRFLRAQIRESQPIESAVDLIRMMKQGRWDQTIVTLCDSLSTASVTMYLAAAIYASWVRGEHDCEVRVFVPCRATGRRMELPLPVVPLPKSCELLAELERNPKAKLKDIQVKLRKHPSTISRLIAAEMRKGYVMEDEDGYHLTQLGKILVEAMRTDQSSKERTTRSRTSADRGRDNRAGLRLSSRDSE